MIDAPASRVRGAPVVLAAVVLAALLVRGWGIGFGLPHTLCRPDERTIVKVALGFFSGDPNPHFLAYPTFYMYVLFGAYLLLYAPGRLLGAYRTPADLLPDLGSDPTLLFLIDRSLAAALGTATVLVVYRLGTCLFDRRTGLLAACFLAFAFLHVRESHFGVTDVPLTFLITLATLLIARAAGDARASRWAAAGLVAGLASATKYSGALIVPAALIALAAFSANDPRRGFDSRGVRLQVDGSAVRRVRVQSDPRMRLALIFLLALVLAVFSASPYVVVEFRTFITDALPELRHLRLGEGDISVPGWQQHLVMSLRYGVGWPLLAAGIAGLLGLALRDRRRATLAGAFPLIYFAAIGSGRATFARYAVPLVPFLCLGAAVTTAQTADRIARAFRIRRVGFVAAALATALILPSAASVLRFDAILARPDSRLLAGAWIVERAAEASSIYQTGSAWGHPVEERNAAPTRLQLWDYDARLATFLVDGRAAPGQPDWIVVQESPLRLYSDTPADVRRLVAAEYTLVATFHAMDADEPANVFDQQDAFYVPLAGFRGIERPGPNLYVYLRN